MFSAQSLVVQRVSLGQALRPQLLCHHQQQQRGLPNATEPRNKLPKLNTEQGSKAPWASAVIVRVSPASAQLFLVTDRCPCDASGCQRDGHSGNYGRDEEEALASRAVSTCLFSA